MLIGYARISTDTQVLDQQIDALIKYGVDPRFIFKEQVSCGAKHRPELEKALAFVKAGDTFVVTKLDRFGRSLEFLIKMMEHFQDKGINFVSLSEKIDTSTATGKMQFQIIASFAEFERNIISERTIEALQAAKLRGKQLGRPNVLNTEKKRIIDDMMKNGESKLQIAKAIGIKSTTPIYKYIRSYRDK